MTIALAVMWDGLPAAQAAGKEVPITIEINASPWYAGFEAVVDRYEKETGNKVNLDVTPFNGMLQKARDAVRGSESPYDLVNLDTGWTIEFYEGAQLWLSEAERSCGKEPIPQTGPRKDCQWHTGYLCRTQVTSQPDRSRFPRPVR